MGLTSLPFPKPARRPKRSRRSTGSPELSAYRAAHPHCEVRGCDKPPCPEPHHIVPRGGRRGRNDAPANLLSLCWAHHAQFHHLGWRKWLVWLGLAGEHLREKVEAAVA